MNESEDAKPVFFIKYFRKIDRDEPMNRDKIYLFFALLIAFMFMEKYTVPVQTSKVCFLVITSHFVLNFLYSFKTQVDLEKILNHHYSMVINCVLGALCLVSSEPSGWFYLAMNLPFIIGNVHQLSNASFPKLKLLILALSTLTIVLFFFVSVPETTVIIDNSIVDRQDESIVFVSLFARKYFKWSLALWFLSGIWVYTSIKQKKEDVYHLANLINFVFIGFLPFLFVFQKNITPPMTNALGYVLLLPTVLIGIVALSLFYYFYANLKRFELFTFLNLLSILYLVVYSNVFASSIFQIIFAVIIAAILGILPLNLLSIFHLL